MDFSKNMYIFASIFKLHNYALTDLFQ